MARESRLWDWLRDGWKGVQHLHARRVENRANDGDPDVDGCYDGVYFELELKGCNRPANRSTPLDFEVRQSQVIWHKRRRRAGGNNWIYIRVGYGRDVQRYLVRGEHAQLLRDGVTEAQLAAASVIRPNHTPFEVLQRVHKGYD